jgi:hypothetical protein
MSATTDDTGPEGGRGYAVPAVHRPPTAAEVTPDWIVERLAHIAWWTGRGSRETTRLRALEVLARVRGMLDGAETHQHVHLSVAAEAQQELAKMMQGARRKIPPEAGNGSGRSNGRSA